MVLGLTKEFFLNSIPYNELDMLDLYKTYDSVEKNQFLNLILGSGQSHENLVYPCKITQFREEVAIIVFEHINNVQTPVHISFDHRF